MPDRHANRREQLLKSLKELGVDALLITNDVNVSYLSGFTGDSTYLLLTSDHVVLISDSRFETQLKEECPDVPALIRTQKTKMVDAVVQAARKSKVKRIGFEASYLAVAAWEAFRDAGGTLEWLPTTGLVEKLRAIKDRGEIAEIRQAVRMAERALQVVTAGLTAADSEIAIAHTLEQEMRRFGATGVSFTPIIAAGDRAALPHYTPGKNPLGQTHQLLIDWGARGPGGYVSDLTRTFAIGKISAKLQKIYDTVNRARQSAIEAIRPGVPARDVDVVARGIIDDAGHGKHFGHGLGHGIGREVHEAIRLSSISDDVLRPGMVITIEPGIYLPGWGGVRIEDDVLVTNDGYEVLSTLPRELEVLPLN